MNYLIIGASSGIGKALHEQLSAAGHSVYTTYNSKAIAGATAQQLEVTSARLDTEHLPEVLDGLVYCPGAIDLKPFSRVKKADILADVELQVIGAVESIQAVLPMLKKSEGASVVLFSTVAVQAGFNYHSQVAISKGAIEGLMRSLAAEFAPKIRFNAIAPSLTETPLADKLLNSDKKKEANAERHPMKRIGTASDIASTAAFLLSDASSWMTGQVLKVDGGMSSIRS